LDIGRKNLPDDGDGMIEQLDALCRYCGHFKYPALSKKERLSPTWKKAYAGYREKKKELSRY